MKLLQRLLRPWRDQTEHLVVKEKLSAHEEVADAYEHLLVHLERERELYMRDGRRRRP